MIDYIKGSADLCFLTLFTGYTALCSLVVYVF